jgi:hypothetical protein
MTFIALLFLLSVELVFSESLPRHFHLSEDRPIIDPQVEIADAVSEWQVLPPFVKLGCTTPRSQVCCPKFCSSWPSSVSRDYKCGAEYATEQ